MRWYLRTRFPSYIICPHLVGPSENPDNPAQRPIVLSESKGKIFFGLVTTNLDAVQPSGQLIYLVALPVSAPDIVN